jgi:5-methylcytosine-specific restriction endonuclease McrA
MTTLERPQKYCTKCKAITSWNTYDRCLACQRVNSNNYYLRKKASGGNFSEAVKKRLKAENPERCPVCGTRWGDVRAHKQHPDTPWHFDHHVSPEHGGTNADENARIMCWPCNLRKANKIPAELK